MTTLGGGGGFELMLQHLPLTPSQDSECGASKAETGCVCTYDHGAIGHLLNEALLQLVELEVERAPAAHQRKQLPQQQRQDYSEPPSSVRSPPWACAAPGASPGASRSSGRRRHLPAVVRWPPRGANEDCVLRADYNSRQVARGRVPEAFRLHLPTASPPLPKGYASPHLTGQLSGELCPPRLA